ncbi:hypothetical protein AB0I81_00930 [Nonomuraea sp. NPDC050404]|uniref:hypothetical protein n=1 Tax=Nonomuraea sp. NPDC050404 TaxID=3155783 RepID=UPI0033E266C4
MRARDLMVGFPTVSLDAPVAEAARSPAAVTVRVLPERVLPERVLPERVLAA